MLPIAHYLDFLVKGIIRTQFNPLTWSVWCDIFYFVFFTWVYYKIIRLSPSTDQLRTPEVKDTNRKLNGWRILVYLQKQNDYIVCTIDIWPWTKSSIWNSILETQKLNPKKD